MLPNLPEDHLISGHNAPHSLSLILLFPRLLAYSSHKPPLRSGLRAKLGPHFAAPCLWAISLPFAAHLHHKMQSFFSENDTFCLLNSRRTEQDT